MTKSAMTPTVTTTGQRRRRIGGSGGAGGGAGAVGASGNGVVMQLRDRYREFGAGYLCAPGSVARPERSRPCRADRCGYWPGRGVDTSSARTMKRCAELPIGWQVKIVRVRPGCWSTIQSAVFGHHLGAGHVVGVRAARIREDDLVARGQLGDPKERLGVRGAVAREHDVAPGAERGGARPVRGTGVDDHLLDTFVHGLVEPDLRDLDPTDVDERDAVPRVRERCRDSAVAAPGSAAAEAWAAWRPRPRAPARRRGP